MRLCPSVERKAPRFISKQYRIVVIQANPKCEHCHKGNAVEIHHKDRNEHNNCFGNLMAVCHKCHHDIHRKRGKPKINYYNRLFKGKRSMKRKTSPNLEQSTI